MTLWPYFCFQWRENNQKTFNFIQQTKNYWSVSILCILLMRFVSDQCQVSLSRSATQTRLRSGALFIRSGSRGCIRCIAFARRPVRFAASDQSDTTSAMGTTVVFLQVLCIDIQPYKIEMTPPYWDCGSVWRRKCYCDNLKLMFQMLSEMTKVTIEGSSNCFYTETPEFLDIHCQTWEFVVAQMLVNSLRFVFFTQFSSANFSTTLQHHL